MVTEGYIRSRPLPPTTSYLLPGVDPVSIPVHPRPTIIRVIYSVFCGWCSKNIVFYRVSGPSAAQKLHLGDVKNVGFSIVLALRGGKNRKNLSLQMFLTALVPT